VPIYDYSCPKCGHKEEKLVFCCADSQVCPECNELLDKEFPSDTRYKLHYDNKTDMCDWSGNTSRYWDDVKKQRKEEGKLTTPVSENIS